MTTKKSKPASLTSSLLARKGEAEPAAAPYSIPESGRQRPAESLAAKGNGNDNGDLGHALTGMARLPGGSEPRAVAAEGAPSGPAEPAELPIARVVPAPVQAAVSPPDSKPVESESAIAEEAVATKSAAPAGERAAAAQMSAAAGAEASTGGGAGSEGGEAEREAARDARLLRFVYVMAALTGIVAIVLYAGGWLRDGPKQRGPEEVVASAPAPSPPSDTATKDAASPAPVPEAGAPAVPEPTVEAQGIPPAPPVVPPAVVETKPSVPEAPVTTGGPAKHQPESLASMPATGPETPAATSQPGTQPTIPAPSDAQAGSSQAGSSQAGSSMAKAPSPGNGNAGPGAPPSASAGAVSSPESPAAAVTAPKPAGPNENVASVASNKPVRDVPNLRVLAPALMKPEPVESAPPPVKPSTNAAAPSPSSVPTVTVPQEVRTASVPKTAPAEPPKAAAADGGFRVQLASVTSEKRAEREWARLQKAFPDVLGGLKLTIEKKDIAGRGTFYRVQTGGYATLDEARSVCDGLKEKKQACLPVNR